MVFNIRERRISCDDYSARKTMISLTSGLAELMAGFLCVCGNGVIDFSTSRVFFRPNSRQELCIGMDVDSETSG